MHMNISKIHDISVSLGEGTVVYPGDCRPMVTRCSTIAGGDQANVSQLKLHAHNGTHLDMPGHFTADGEMLGEENAGRFILDALVVEIADAACVDLPELAELVELSKSELAPGDAILFKTRNAIAGMLHSLTFSEDYVYLTAQAARWCAEQKVGLVGIDYLSIDQFGCSDYPAHRTLGQAGVIILESVDLAGVPPGRYTLICLPLKLDGAEASPVRAVLIE